MADYSAEAKPAAVADGEAAKAPPTTEDVIFLAARDVFYESGFTGARMQEIAKRAGINHSMLHYYYRSKSQLFDAVFSQAVGDLMPPVISILGGAEPLMSKIERFSEAYISMVSANPHLPAFIIEELRRNPGAIAAVAGTLATGVFDRLQLDLDASAARGEIRSQSARHFFANLIGLCVFPFIARPMLQAAFADTPEAYEAFLSERPAEVVACIRGALFI